MNKIIFVSALLVALCGSIKAELTSAELDACIKDYGTDFDAVVIPERIEQVAEIVRGYEPGNNNLTDIINNYEIDGSAFVKDSDDAEALKEIALELSSSLFGVLTQNACLVEDEFQKYLNSLPEDKADPNHAKQQKFNDYMELCGELQSISEEFEDAEEEFEDQA